MSKLKTYKGDKAKADRLYSLIIRSIGYCEAEGWNSVKCTPQLQTMHIISRRYSNTRTDLRNALSGCAAHHRYFTDHPREFSHFISDTWAARTYEEIHWKSQQSTKVNWADRVHFLTGIKELLETGQIDLTEAREMEGELWTDKQNS